MIRYVHCCKEQCDFYCGRKTSLHKALGNPIDLSILSNPIPLRDESDRPNCIRLYAKHLLELMKKNPFVIEILKTIPDDSTIGCFCYPKDCHCRIIIEAREYVKKHNL